MCAHTILMASMSQQQHQRPHFTGAAFLASRMCAKGLQGLPQKLQLAMQPHACTPSYLPCLPTTPNVPLVCVFGLCLQVWAMHTAFPNVMCESRPSLLPPHALPS